MVKEATLGAGCFWCIEACFQSINGVINVFSGYSGGDEATANNDTVCGGNTNHAEVARVIFDDSIVSFDKLLEMFWFVHDPTQLNKQGNDVGRHYRSVVFYHNDEQRISAEMYKKRLEKEKIWEKPIVTEISALKEFYKAEKYHDNYLENNPGNPYCHFVIRPKVEAFNKVFSNLLK